MNQVNRKSIETHQRHPGWRCGLAFAATLLALTIQAQELSANVRLLNAARTGDEAGVRQALRDGAASNARNRLGEMLGMDETDEPEPGITKTA